MPQQYTPVVHDLVIATVTTSSIEHYTCTVSPHGAPCLLPVLAFEGATRKTRPLLGANMLVYARITATHRDTPPELTCVDPATGKADGLGPLKGGMVYRVSLALTRRLLSGKKGGVTVLDGLSERLSFEVAVGRNGLVWVDGGDVKTTTAVGWALHQLCIIGLEPGTQKKLVDKVLRDF